MEIIKLKDYKNIYAVDSFFAEYSSLFGKSKAAHTQYLKKLRTNLGILDREMKKSIQYQQFEQLENTNLYSIRHVSTINPRVVFAYIDNDGKVILLSSFKEKKRADYDRAVEQAKLRLKQLEGEQ